MRARHGDPKGFLESIEKSFVAGDISFGEAERANLAYRKEYKGAPEKTKVEENQK